MKDTCLALATWGSRLPVDIQDCHVMVTDQATRAPFRLSAGTAESFSFMNSTVVTQSRYPAFELYDTTYTAPNGNIQIKHNLFLQNKHQFIFSGVALRRGIVNYTETDNEVFGAEKLDPKYIDNEYFIIHE
mgnify:CR=1 FL=1